MRSSHLAAGLCLLAVAACGRGGEAETPAAAGAPAAATPEVAEAAAPSPAEADFVGVWAAAPELCDRNETWRLTPERLATAGGTSCAIEGAARSADGWRLQAVCTAGGAPTPANLTLAMTPAPVSGMTVSGGPFAGRVSLVRCTPSLAAAAG